MQEYRINYKLLIGLFVGTGITVVLLYLLWGWQVNRKASWYRDTAEEALEEQDTLKAFQYMKYFVKLRRDNDEARVKLATIAFDVLKTDGVPREDGAEAFGYISDTVRRTNDEETRRKLADLYFDWGKAQQAQVHYEELLTQSDDPELKSRYVRTLFLGKDYKKGMKMAYELVGLDPQTDTFDDEKAEVTDQPEVYAALAGVILDRENDEELATKIIDKMIEKNPDSAIAHLSRSIFIYAEDKEIAQEELDKAYALDPENSAILSRKVQLALQEEDPNEAIELAKLGIEKHPKALEFYIYSSRAHQRAGDLEASLEILDRGIREFGEQRSVALFREKFTVLLKADDVKGCKKVIKELEDLKETALEPLIDFQKAQIAYFQRDWVSAAKQLRRVRPMLVFDRKLQIQAGVMLGEAFEKLGKNDKALEFYRLIANDETIPSSYPLKQIADNRRIKLEEKMGMAQKGQTAMDFSSIVAAEIEKEEDEQDWDKIEEMIEELAEANSLSEAKVLLVQADILRKRGMIEEAKDKVRAANQADPNEPAVMLTAAQVFLSDLPDGPAKAKGLIKKIESKSGITIQTRVLLMEAIIRSQGEDMNSELMTVVQDIDSLNDDEKSRILFALGSYFSKFGELEQAESLTLQAVELAPGDLPKRTALFEIAVKRRDEDGMRRAQEMILEVVGSKDDGAYIISEVRRRLFTYRGDSTGRRGLVEARKMLDDLLKRRPKWHELHIVYSQLLLTLGQEMDLVLEHFDDALRYGPPNNVALIQQVTILAESGLMSQARERMNLLPEKVRNPYLGATEADILMATGDMEAAYESAAKTAERKQNDPKIQSWFGRIAEQSSELDAAAEAYQRVAKLSPKNEANWRRLLATHAKREDTDEVIATMRSAQLSVEPEVIPLLQATFFELQNQWRNSESIHLALFEDDYLTNPDSARQLAAFYYRWGMKDQEKIELAFPYLNSILRAGQEGDLSPSNNTLLYAAERAALTLSLTNDYRDAMDALQIIRQCSSDGSVPAPLQPLYMQVLGSRNDPESILELIDLLSKLYEQGRLDKANQLRLAQLYERTYQWKKGKDLMIDALGKFESDEDVWTTYINLLIKQGEFSTASNRINRFADRSKNPGTIASLRASLAYQQGDPSGVKTALKSLLPPGGITGALSEDDLKMIKAVAAMAIEYGEYQSAEQLLRIYVRRKNPDGVFELVSLLAMHGDLNEALASMEKIFPSNPMGIARLSVQVLRERVRELDQGQVDKLMSFVSIVVDELPDDPERIMMRGEAHEVLEKYDEAIADYEQAMEMGLDPVREAIALNNTAYLLGNTGQRLDETTEMIQRAIDVLGPLSEILDTRAVILTARKEYNRAVEDMVLALAVDPTASKYYHLARAQALAGNSEEALKAWEKARELKIEKEDLPLMEQSGYAETERLIKKLQDR